jgi:hypothetical protein
VIFNPGLGPKTGPRSVEETSEPLRSVFPLLALMVIQIFNHVEIFRREVRWRLNSPPEFFPPVRPGGVVRAPPAGHSRILSLGDPPP